MGTVTLSASEFQERVGEALDRSLSQPVLITKHGRPRNVVLSYDEYERLSARDRRAVRAEDLTDEDIAALEASEMAPGFEHLDAELDPK
jgi:prevent-host-death family protein